MQANSKNRQAISLLGRADMQILLSVMLTLLLLFFSCDMGGETVSREMIKKDSVLTFSISAPVNPPVNNRWRYQCLDGVVKVTLTSLTEEPPYRDVERQGIMSIDQYVAVWHYLDQQTFWQLANKTDPPGFVGGTSYKITATIDKRSHTVSFSSRSDYNDLREAFNQANRQIQWR